MEKVYLGEYGGHHYYMADKVYNNLDYWEASALAEQMGGDFPDQHGCEALREYFEANKEKRHILEGETFFINPVEYCDCPSVAENFGWVTGFSKRGGKHSCVIMFKTPVKEDEWRDSASLSHAKQFLKKALEVQDSRANEYDTDAEEERNMGKIVRAFNAITGHTLTEAEGYLFMETLKNVRLFGAPSFHEDSAVDGISYASLKAEAKAKEG